MICCAEHFQEEVNGMGEDYVGRVCGNSVMEMRFRTGYDKQLQVGEMLVIEDGRSDRRYLVRTRDIEFGAEAEDKRWMEKEAGQAIGNDVLGQSYEASAHGKSIYRLGLCFPLGYLEGSSFKKAKSIPEHFSLVRRANQGDYQFLQPLMGDIEIGKLRSGDHILDFPVGISGQALPYHIGVFATTGMGKSNLMKSLALSCMTSRKYGFLILDPHGEYYDGGESAKKGLKHAPNAHESLEVYSSRPLQGAYNSIHVSSSEIEIPDLANLYEFTGAQLECLQAAQWKYGDDWLVELLHKDVKSVVKDLGDKFHEGTVNVIKRRLDSIFQFDLITTDKKLSITKNIIAALHGGKTVLVDTSNMFEAEELLISTILARAIFEYQKSLYSDQSKFEKIPPTLIALEEAQRVLSQSKGTVFAQIAREGRKFKLGLCAISQQPKLINEEVISQFNTLFILGLADKRDRDILRNSAKQDISMLDNEIQMLMPGEVLVASPFTPFAVPAKVHLYEERLEHFSMDAPRSKTLSKQADSRFF
ncbi:MAG: AAA-like domain protein [Methanomassiliicoccales archaeon PtaU1.Bin124]|nr:MAG: AAA-like domain protein [Methanomassiliicoccales archaeon PtaU1.Bin124]